MKALYRKYRPLKLSEVIGQDQVVKTLENSLKNHKISHAYLFTGPRGCGKTSVARIFAHEINNFEYQLEDSYTDIIEIDAASNTGVDNIRELKERAMVAPTAGKFKVYIIDEVHMLSKSAFNALLKLLEEPPAHVVFIMATTDAYKVPITITSRAQNFTFQLASPEIMKKHLADIAKKEQISIDDEAIDTIVLRGGGSFRDSISLLDQISTISDEKITKETIISALGLPEDAIITQILAGYEAGDLIKITENAKTAVSAGLKPELFAESLIKSIAKDPKPAYLGLLGRLSGVSAPYAEAKLLYALLADFASIPQIIAPESQKPAKKPTKTATIAPETPANAPFSWDTFIEKVTGSSKILGNYLRQAQPKITDHELSICFAKPIHQNIATRPNNLEILKQFAGGLTLVFKDHNDQTPSSAGKLSDIMGDVQEVTDGNPFQ